MPALTIWSSVTSLIISIVIIYENNPLYHYRIHRYANCSNLHSNNNFTVSAERSLFFNVMVFVKLETYHGEIASGATI